MNFLDKPELTETVEHPKMSENRESLNNTSDKSDSEEEYKRSDVIKSKSFKMKIRETIEHSKNRSR